MATTAFSIATGRQLWERPQTMPAAGVSTRGTLLLTGYDTVFRPDGAVAVDISTGKVRWQTARAWSVRAGDYTGRFFLVDDQTGTLHKVNARSGKIAWKKRPLSASRWCPPYRGPGRSLTSSSEKTSTEGMIPYPRSGYAASAARMRKRAWCPSSGCALPASSVCCAARLRRGYRSSGHGPEALVAGHFFGRCRARPYDGRDRHRAVAGQ